MLIHGEKAHSCYFSKDAFKKLKGDNKELLIIPGASHVDLYDNQAGAIPFDKIESFFRENLKSGWIVSKYEKTLDADKANINNEKR